MILGISELLETFEVIHLMMVLEMCRIQVVQFHQCFRANLKENLGVLTSMQVHNT